MQKLWPQHSHHKRRKLVRGLRDAIEGLVEERHQQRMRADRRRYGKLRSWLGDRIPQDGTHVRGALEEQHGFPHGVSLAKPQVRDQIGMFDQSGWIRRDGSASVFTLGGQELATEDEFTFTIMDTVDLDFVVDYAAALTTVTGTSEVLHVDFMTIQPVFSALFLPHFPTEHLLLGVWCRIVQIVALRYGTVKDGNDTHQLQPGMGVIGNFTSSVALTRGGQYCVRVRLYKTTLARPLQWSPASTWSGISPLIQAPLVEWERRWELAVPRQRAFDRIGTDIQPMPNTYSFSFKPTYPYQFSMFGDVINSATLEYALMFDPNEVDEMVAPLLGIVATTRRTALAVIQSSPFAPGNQQLLVRCNQYSRVYVRLLDSNGELITWAQMRSDPNFLVLGIGFLNLSADAIEHAAAVVPGSNPAQLEALRSESLIHPARVGK